MGGFDEMATKSATKSKGEKKEKDRCWPGYEAVPGKKAYTEGSCRKAGAKKK